jgi:hypothetical protein
MMVSGSSLRRVALFVALCASFAFTVFLGFSLRAHADTFPTPCDIFNQLGQNGLPPGSCAPTCVTGQHLDTNTNECVPDVPTCADGQHLDTDTNQCVPDAPVCSTGQHLDTNTNTCVPDSTGGTDTGGTATSTTTSTDSGSGDNSVPQGGGPSTTDQNSNTGSNSGGGGGASTLIFNTGTSTASSTDMGGEVLGTSTEATSSGELPASCTPLITTYLRMGSTDKDQVMKLQGFLNVKINAGLPVTGMFGQKTFDAVKKFQTQYWQDVLAPWVPFGLQSDHTATGYVYKTTQRMINLLSCNNAIDIPQPALP